ncbi:MAG: pilus assembly protein PilP [Burkholderiales bacterium]|nr:pilus assembly protein PilP [Burkholderiales bacterium]
MNSKALIIALLGVTTLAGCSSEEHSDLRQFVRESDKLPGGRIPPLPEVKPYEPFAYNAYELTDPFRPRKIEPPKSTVKGGLQPDFNRAREALEAFPLENLKMVGTLQQKGQTFALVKSPDSALFRVKAGNYMGQNFGRITAISETDIKLKEIVQDSGGNWEEKEQALMLQEQGGGK